jgi:hypothetical protein
LHETLLSGMQDHMLLHTRQSAIQNNKNQFWPCSKAVYKPVWHIPLLSVQWMNWWWTDELSEICRVLCQNKFVKLVHLFGFIAKKFVTMHGHMNVKCFTFSEPFIVIHICEKDQQVTHFFFNNLFHLLYPRHFSNM